MDNSYPPSTRLIIGGINPATQGRDPRYDQSANLPDLGKGDLVPVAPVAPAPTWGPYPFKNVRSGR